MRWCIPQLCEQPQSRVGALLRPALATSLLAVISHKPALSLARLARLARQARQQQQQQQQQQWGGSGCAGGAAAGCGSKMVSLLLAKVDRLATRLYCLVAVSEAR